VASQAITSQATKKKGMQPADYAALFGEFTANISKYDCGKYCAALNGGQPVCCTTDHAIPIVDKTEFALLKTRTNLWRPYVIKDAQARKLLSDLHKTTCAIECKGAAFCERENRTLACRTFPFYPYITRQNEVIGLATYWTFEDRCWLMSNFQVVERNFVKQFIEAFQYVFDRDELEWESMRNNSAHHRRQFTKQNRIIPLIGKDGGFFKVMPATGQVRPAKIEEFRKIGPYRSDRAYQKAVKEAQGTAIVQTVMV
jgi:hypothetical protein